jgi:hypothetical protein
LQEVALGRQYADSIAVLFACVTASVSVQAQTVKSTTRANLEAEAPLGDKVTMRSGDRLTGKIVGLDCHGLKLRYYDNNLQVPLDKLASASSAADVPVSGGIGNDRLTGRIRVSATTVYVSTRDLGEVALPIAALQCKSGSKGDAVDTGEHPGGEAHNRPGIGPKRGSSSVVPAGARPLSAATMPFISGAGAEPADYSQEGQTPRLLAENLPVIQPSSPATETGALVQSSSGSNPQPASNPPPITKEEEEETERNVLEFIRTEAVVVQPGKVEGDFSLSYLHTNQLLGNEKIVGFSSTARFGVIQGLEGFLAVPFFWGQRQTTELTSVISNELKGLGDLRFGLKYRILKESAGIPDVVIGASASAPTGRPPYLAPIPGAVVAGDTRDPLNIQIGTGHWILTGSATAFKSYDPLVLYTTLNYTHLIPATYFGVHIVPGDIWELNSGLGFSVNDTNTLSAQLFIDYQEKWQFNRAAVPQTEITPITLKLSYIHVLSPNDLIQPAVFLGLTRDANDAVVMLDYIHRF